MKPRRLLSNHAVIASAASAAVLVSLSAQAQDVYLFSYFRETNGASGLHLAYSLDGHSYHAVNGGNGLVTDIQSTPFMRDPFIIYGQDGKFHLTYTTGWGGAIGGNPVKDTIGYSSSTDLLNWATPVHKVLPIANGQERWAPQVYWDSANSQYMVNWATRVGSGYLDMYYSTTTDFNTFSTPQILYTRGANHTLDGDIVFDGTNYSMFIAGTAIARGGTNLYGPYTSPSEQITSGYASEGPSAIKIGDKWIVYNDHYTSGRYGAMVSTDDLATFSEYTGAVAFPGGTRHGNVFTVPLAVAQNLVANAASKPLEDEFVIVTATRDFHMPANWFSGAVPGANQTPVIQGGFTADMNSSPSATLPGLKVGQTSTGTLNIKNSSAVTLNSAWPNGLVLGERLGGNGTIVQSGSSSVTVNGYATIGTRGAGTYRLQSGSLTVNGDFNIGDYLGAQGNLNQEGGTINAQGLFVAAGVTGGFTTGTTTGGVLQSGGTLNVTGGGNSAIIGGRNTGSASAAYEISGGTLNVNSTRLIVGNLGAGSFAVGGSGYANLPVGLRIADGAGSSGTVHLNGGTIVTPVVQGGAGTSTFRFNGGTLKAAASSAAFMTGLTTVEVQSGGAVIDTNGYDITLTQPLTAASPNGGLTKTGAGVLTLSTANGYSGMTTISQGTLRIGATPAPTAAHRWSFNGSLVDSVGGSDASIVNVGANNVTLSGTQATLAGGTRSTSDYISLGSNLLPDSNSPVTIELWATQQSVQSWGRIFDFGSGSTENLFMSWTRGTTLSNDRVEWRDGVTTGVSDTNQPYTLGTEFHIVMTLTPLGDSTQVTWYSAPAGSAELGSTKGSFTTANTLASFTDSANNLGRSFYSTDNTANASYNEVRIWNGALVPHILEILHDAGPNANLNSLNLGSAGSLPLNTAVNINGSGAVLDLNNVSHVIGSLSGVAGSAVTLGSAILTTGANNASTGYAGAISGTGGIIKSGTGTQTFTGANTYTGLTSVQGGALVLGLNSHAPVLADLTTPDNADVKAGLLVFDYNGGSTVASQVLAILDAGYDQPTPFSSGKIFTSNAPDPSKALGWKDDTIAKQVTVAYAYKGDTDLNGVVDSMDFNAFVASYGMSGGASWQGGDSDYDGAVTTIDFNYLAGNFGLPALAGELPASVSQSLVPEPSSALAAGVMVLALRMRRRR